MRICPKCRAFYGDPQLAFCLADGTPLANVDPQSDKIKEGSRVIQEQAKRFSKRSRRLRWRKIALASMTTLVMTMVVSTSFTVETTPPSQTESPSTLPSPDASPSLTPTESPSSSASPSVSPSPSPSPSVTPSPSATVTYRISGRVIDPSHSLAGTSAQIVLDGSKHASMMTDANGNFAFSDLPEGGNYTITAIAPVNFTTPKLSFAKLSRNETGDFTVQSFKISGRVMSFAGPVQNVKVLIQGSKSASVNTDPSGYFVFSDLRAGGSYTIIPKVERLQSASRLFENLRRDETADFMQGELTPPPPKCIEAEMYAEAMEVSQAWHVRLREMIGKYEHAEEMPDVYVNGVKKAKFGWGPVQRKDIRFLEPCKVFVVNIQYAKQLPGNPETHREPEVIRKSKDFTCEKRKDGWQCR